MESDPKHDAELARLRLLGTWMRDVGAIELDLGDVRIKLAPKPREAPARAQSVDPDEARLLAEEAAAEKDLSEEERAHRRYWKRLTRSSGAPIPPFKRRRAMPETRQDHQRPADYERPDEASQ